MEKLKRSLFTMSYYWRIWSISLTLETWTTRETLKSRMFHTHWFCRELRRENVQRKSKQTFWSILNTNNSPHLHTCFLITWTMDKEQSFCGVSYILQYDPISVWAHLNPILKKIREELTDVDTLHFFKRRSDISIWSFICLEHKYLSKGSRRLIGIFIQLATEKVSQTELVPHWNDQPTDGSNMQKMWRATHNLLNRCMYLAAN